MSTWNREHVTGTIGGLKCLEPAGRQKTNDDEWILDTQSNVGGGGITIGAKLESATHEYYSMLCLIIIRTYIIIVLNISIRGNDQE